MVFIFSNSRMGLRLLAVLGFLMLVAYLAVFLPMFRSDRALDRELAAKIQELNEKGYGLETSVLAGRLREVNEELDLLRRVADGSGYTLETVPKIEERIGEYIYQLEFRDDRSAIVNRLRRRAEERGIRLREAALSEMPHYTGEEGQEQGRLKWIRLVLAEQVLAGALECGVGEIEALDFTPVREVRSEEDMIVEELGVNLRVTGEMEALQFFFLFLMLNEDQLEASGFPFAHPGKRGFFIDRFMLRKTAIERPEEVTAELRIKSFLRRNGN